MAGTDPNFDAAGFRTNIQAVMKMAAPNGATEGVFFRWTEQRTYPIQDPARNPYTWTTGATPATDIIKSDVQVSCVVQYQERSPDGTAAGDMDVSRVIVTLLDVDYALVATANTVVINNRSYDISLWAPPQGLFDVTIHEAYLTPRA